MIADIALMDKKLQIQRKRMINHKRYVLNAINYKAVFAVALLVPLILFWSRKSSARKWPAMITGQIVQIGTAAALAYAQKQIMTLINKH